MAQALSIVAALPETGPQLIGGRYAIDFTRPLPLAAPGEQAYVAQDRDGRPGLMAVQSQPGLPPRARVLAALLPAPISGLLSPLAHGPMALRPGEQGYFVVCDAPVGRPVSEARRSWPEHELIERVLRPIAGVLEALAARNVTHRAIRPENVFQAAPGERVVLGAAWTQPPGFAQSALFEPPYVASCLPAGRGDGSIADDVYALGVLLIVLALGSDPLEGLTPDAVIRRKLNLGSFVAIVGDRRLPFAIADLARFMLADDPDHRPSPTLLGNPDVARAKRIASHPSRRAPRPIEVKGEAVWNTRVLAYALGHDPQPGVALLRSGAVAQWLKRSLGDSSLASRVEDVERIRATAVGHDAHEDALLLTRTVAILDPLAPLCWPGATVWHDGIGPALVYGNAFAPAQSAALEEAIKADAVSVWAAMRADRCDPTDLRIEARRWRTVLTGPNAEFAKLRLAYALNPLQACASPLLAGQVVTRPVELLPALEAAAATTRAAVPVDHHIAAFLAGKRDDRTCTDIRDPSSLPTIEADPLAQLRLLARLQVSNDPGPTPKLAAWLAEAIRPALTRFRSRSCRTRLELHLQAQAKTGSLSAMLQGLNEASEREVDRAGWEVAQARAREIDIALAERVRSRTTRDAALRELSGEIAGGTGLLAAGASVVLSLLSG